MNVAEYIIRDQLAMLLPKIGSHKSPDFSKGAKNVSSKESITANKYSRKLTIAMERTQDFMLK